MASSSQPPRAAECNICGENDFQRLFTAPAFDGDGETFQLAECLNCHLVRTEPFLDDRDLAGYYGESYYGAGNRKFSGLAEGLTRLFNSLRARRLLSLVSHRHGRASNAPIRVLDIGCGRGDLLKALSRKGCECVGVERADFPADVEGPGIRFFRKELRGISFDTDSFELVILWHVLEHVSDPKSLLREIARILRPGGALVIAVPNFSSFQAKLFSHDWFHLDLPRHVYHFTPGVLRRFFNKEGFLVRSVSTYCLEQNVYGFIQSCLNKAVPFARPNALYSLLKGGSGRRRGASLMAWLALACLISPAALLEYALSGMVGAGATALVCAQKSDGGSR